MFNKENTAEWIILAVLGTSLSFLYGFNLTEMLKRILEWGFALTGFKLLFDYGIIKQLNNVFIKE